jgi:hypothetical protein
MTDLCWSSKRGEERGGTEGGGNKEDLFCPTKGERNLMGVEESRCEDGD